jgi:hypothetical protein
VKGLIAAELNGYFFPRSSGADERGRQQAEGRQKKKSPGRRQSEGSEEAGASAGYTCKVVYFLQPRVLSVFLVNCYCGLVVPRGRLL